MQLYGGPAQPSPTIAQCINGGFPWLMAECRRCRHEAKISLEDLKQRTSVTDYYSEFLGIAVQAKDMHEADKLHAFKRCNCKLQLMLQLIE